MTSAIRQPRSGPKLSRATVSCVALVLTLSPAVRVVAQDTDAASAPAPTPTPIQAIETSDISGRAAEVRRDLDRWVPREADTSAVDEAVSVLPRLESELDRLRVRLAEALHEPASLRVLKDEKVAWTLLAARLDALDDRLERQARDILRTRSRLEELETEWAATVAASEDRDDPPVVRQEAREALDTVSQADALLDQRLDPILDTQARVSALRRDVADAIERIERRVTVFGLDMLRPDSVPVWRVFDGEATHRFHYDPLLTTARTRLDDLGHYVMSRSGIIWLQIVIWLVLGIWLTALRRRQVGEDLDIHATENVVLRAPFTVALLVSITIGIPFHTSAPRAWSELLYVVVLAALARLAVGALPRRTAGAVIALSFLGVLHWVAYMVPDVHPIDRWLWLAVSGLGAVLVPVFARPVLTVFGEGTQMWSAVRSRLAAVVTAAFVVSTIANLAGMLDLAVVITGGVMISLYVAAVMWTLTRVLDGVVGLFLRAAWPRRSRIIRNHADIVRAGLRRLFRLVAVVLWVIATLDAFLLWTPLHRSLQAAFGASFTVGSLTISLGSVLAATIALWIAFEISRIVRFFFEEEVSSRIALPPGVPATMSRLIHYTIMVVGVFVALAAAGIHLGQLAIVAGAFGVGIGFGLQTIVNNFVSGLILMFERPIRIGDVVQLGTLSGTVTEIGIRASRVRTWDGAEVVVPNGNLISNDLINWTLSDATRRLELPVGVAYGTDPERVIELLIAEMKAHENVLPEPEPFALFVGFGDSSLDFSARCWCRFADSLATASDLHVAFNRALAEAGIEIPFPQRDLHLRSVDPDAARGKPDERLQQAQSTPPPPTGEGPETG